MEQRGLFFQLGKLIYKGRILIILLWVLMMLACVPFIPHIMTPFKTTGFVDETSNSVKTDNYLKKKLGYGKNRILIIYTSHSLLASNPVFIKKIKDSLS